MVSVCAERHGHFSGWRWLTLGGLALLVYSQALIELVGSWLTVPEFSHGLLIPFVVVYIIWENRSALCGPAIQPSRWGVVACVLAQALLVLATLADVDRAKYYALWLTLVSLVWSWGGTTLLRRLCFPLLLLLTAIPLPYLLNKLLTLQLQLISSDLGVALIRTFGMPVYQDGNIIQLGTVQLLVAEACSGLRYLLPLLSISLILAYFFRGPAWLRIVMVALAVPVTVIMNSVRIAVTGILIKLYGNQVAEGFLHAFEGWVVFMAALAVLLCCIFLLTRLLPQPRTFIHYFIAPDSAPSSGSTPGSLQFPASLSLCAMTLLLTAPLVLAASQTGSASQPEREPFSRFPFTLDSRQVQLGDIDAEMLGVLRADDYFMGDFVADGHLPVNLYMAYYAQQADGAAIHSPRDCLPAGNWSIDSLEQVALPEMVGNSNRAIIRKGGETLLVYYWIHQQGNNYANEFAARTMLLRDAIINHRTDASLVRVAVPVVNDDLPGSEQQLREFIGHLATELPRFLPGRDSTMIAGGDL